MANCPTEEIIEGELPVVATLKTDECCRHMGTGKAKVFTAAVDATTSTNTVVESDCRSVGITDHKGDAPTRYVVEHTHVMESAEFIGRGTDTPALDAVVSAGSQSSILLPIIEI
ncbi:hypothetical protein Plhal710r2_c087g0182501 [Plasmopara halstedii]